MKERRRVFNSVGSLHQRRQNLPEQPEELSQEYRLESEETSGLNKQTGKEDLNLGSKIVITERTE